MTTSEQQEQTEREDAAQVLPAAPFPELTFERVLLRREHLLTEIDRRARAHSPERAPRVMRRIVLTLISAAAAGATVAVVALSDGADQEAPPASAASVQLLERAALAADEQPTPTVRADQYTYVKVMGFSTVLS